MRLRFALLAALSTLLLLAAPARADEGFGLKNLAVDFTEEDGSVATALKAGSHPYAMRTTLDVNTIVDPELGEIPIDAVKDLEIEFPPGLVADPGAVPTCPSAVFLASAEDDAPQCPDATVLGTTEITIGTVGPDEFTLPVYNLTAPGGAVLKLGFIALQVPVSIEIGLDSDPPYGGIVSVTNISQAINFYASETTIWGDPAHPSHDDERGTCLISAGADECPVGGSGRPFLTAPRSCGGPLETTFRARSWQNPESWFEETVRSAAIDDCASLPFAPTIEARPTTDRVSSPSGLAFDLDVADQGLISPSGRAQSDIRAAQVTLPAGVTINPSQAEGLAVCSEAQLAKETATSPFGAGCPSASKIGTVEVESPLLPGQILGGSLFVAEPYANRFGSLIALFMTIKSPERGLSFNLAGKVEPTQGTGPQAGRLLTTFGGAGTDPLPQLPFSHFRLRFREGGRAPLITPPACGSYETQGLFTPHARPATQHPVASSFQIEHGLGGGPCPPPGSLPFQPGFAAGSLNNHAGSHSAFFMRLTRRDGDQDMSRFDSLLPPGVTGRLAGVAQCPEGAIAAAKAKSGKAELASPSCPATSQIGHTFAGAGVGSQLTYVPGKLYLAGPFGGAPLSVVAITPAVAGPFDVGTVVVREALSLDPVTAQVRVDGAASDQIPHTLAGIPLALRDLRVHVDRERFVLNPTSCEPDRVRATLFGAGSAFSPATPFGVPLSARFQAADCASLGFKPKLGIKLRGGTRRGAHPALRAHVVPRPGDANFSRAVVTLPRSAFLDQGHIRTICTRVQFAAGAGNGANCPPGARYGFARAWTPLLDGPLSGPVFLRSSDNNLPDLVVALHGPPSAAIDIELSARIDSVKGGIRSTFTGIPDAPVSRFILDMQGGKKGLIVNSRNLCVKPKRNRAKANLRGQNGKFSRTRPVVRAQCKKKGKKRRAGRSSHRRPMR